MKFLFLKYWVLSATYQHAEETESQVTVWKKDMALALFRNTDKIILSFKKCEVSGF